MSYGGAFGSTKPWTHECVPREAAMRKQLCLLGSLLCACSSTDKPEAPFLAALPTRQTVEVLAPDAGVSPQGDTAELYILTRQTTVAVNGLVGGVLDTLGNVASNPPTTVSPDGATWGPFSDALSPVVWRLAVLQLGPGQHSFLLEIRPKAGTDGDFQTFLQGASQGSNPGGPNMGTFSVDLGLAQQLDPVANPDVGQVVAAWNAQPTGREVHVALAGVHAPSLPPASADIGSVLFPDGSGALSFDANTTLVVGSDVVNVERVGSHWVASGAGRADAEVHQADGGWGVQLTECWNSSFDSVYVRAENSTGDGGTEGVPSACVFAVPLL
jgi:hypothetical protein